MLRRLVSPTRTQARVYDREGALLLDTRNLYGRGDVLRFEQEFIDHVRRSQKDVLESIADTQKFEDERDITVTKGDTHTIDGVRKEHYNAGRERDPKQFDNTTVNGANKNTTVHGQYNITADEHFKVLQGGNQIFVKDQVFVESTGKIQIQNQQCKLELADHGRLVEPAGDLLAHLRRDEEQEQPDEDVDEWLTRSGVNRENDVSPDHVLRPSSAATTDDVALRLTFLDS